MPSASTFVSQKNLPGRYRVRPSRKREGDSCPTDFDGSYQPCVRNGQLRDFGSAQRCLERSAKCRLVDVMPADRTAPRVAAPLTRRNQWSLSGVRRGGVMMFRPGDFVPIDPFGKPCPLRLDKRCRPNSPLKLCQRHITPRGIGPDFSEVLFRTLFRAVVQLNPARIRMASQSRRGAFIAMVTCAVNSIKYGSPASEAKSDLGDPRILKWFAGIAKDQTVSQGVRNGGLGNLGPTQRPFKVISEC